MKVLFKMISRQLQKEEVKFLQMEIYLLKKLISEEPFISMLMVLLDGLMLIVRVMGQSMLLAGQESYTLKKTFKPLTIF